MFRGCLSSKSNAGIYDFNFLLAAFAECGYSCGWRILDSQYVRVDGFPRAVPQRRRRVFVVGHLGKQWEYPAKVLFEQQSLLGNTPPCRIKGKGFTADVERSIGTASTDVSGLDCYNQCLSGDVSMTVTSKRSDPHHVPCAVQSVKSTFWNGKDVAETLTAKGANDRMPDKNILPCVITTNGADVSDTLDASYYKGVGNRNGNERTIICLNDQGGSVMAVEENGNAGTLRANFHGNEQIVCWAAGGFGQKVESDVSATISSDHDDRVTGNNVALNQERIGYYPSQHQCPKQSDTPTLTTDNFSGVRGDTPLVQEYYNWHSQSHSAVEIADDCSPTLPAAMGMGGASMTTPLLIKECYAVDQGAGKSSCSVSENISPTLATTHGGEPVIYKHNELDSSVAIAENIIGRKVENGGNGVGAQEELAYTQNATGVMGVANNATVRRLLPIECERLMGFPDNHTRISWKGKSPEECPDAPRYKACGNSMCVNVMRWIGMQIDRVDKMESSDEQ